MQRIIVIDRNDDCHEMEQRFPSRGHDEMPCYVCGRATKYGKRRMLHIVDGGSGVMDPACECTDDEAAGDLYWYPIGDTCLRKHPELRPYAVKE